MRDRKHENCANNNYTQPAAVSNPHTAESWTQKETDESPCESEPS